MAANVHQAVIKRSSSGHQAVINRQSEAIRSNQKQSAAITGFKDESFSRVESARAPVSTRDPSYMSTSWS
jgi:hypothetical protein